MKDLKKAIIEQAEVLPGDVLKVEGFLNHQVDIELIAECGKMWYEKFKNEGITKILTIESSGIAIASLTAQYFGVPMIYAKKAKSAAYGKDHYTTKVVSYTHSQTYDVFVSKKFITPDDKILLIDDFLANGSALKGLITLSEMGGAKVVGAGVVIEKEYENGGKDIRDLGYRIEPLAKIKCIENGNVIFAE